MWHFGCHHLSWMCTRKLQQRSDAQKPRTNCRSVSVSAKPPWRVRAGSCTCLYMRIRSDTLFLFSNCVCCTCEENKCQLYTRALGLASKRSLFPCVRETLTWFKYHHEDSCDLLWAAVNSVFNRSAWVLDLSVISWTTEVSPIFNRFQTRLNQHRWVWPKIWSWDPKILEQNYWEPSALHQNWNRTRSPVLDFQCKKRQETVNI